MISFLAWIVTGLIVGLIARALVPGKQSMGLILTVALGVIGAFVGGLISSAIWPVWGQDPQIDQMWPGWLMSVVGAIIVLFGYVALTRDGARA